MANDGRRISLGLIALMVLVTASPLVTVDASGPAPRLLTEDETAIGGCSNNDNFACAQTILTVTTLGGEETLTGTSSIADRTDHYRIEDVAPGMILNASLHLTSSAGFGDQVIYIELYNPYKNDRIAWSESKHPWEAVSALVVIGGDWYLRLISKKDAGSQITYTLNVRAEFPEEIDITGLNPGQEITRTVSISNASYRPGYWWRIKADAGTSVNDVINVSAAGWDPVTDGQFDLYIRDFRGFSWANWYNVSWWGEEYPPGGTGRIEEAEAATSFTTALDPKLEGYYVDIQAWNGSGSATLYFAKKTHASDGDNTPDDAVEMVRTPGQQAFVVEDHVDWSYDHQDWYKFDLAAGESMSAKITLKNQPVGIYRVSIHTVNDTNGGYNVVHSVSNIVDEAPTNSATASVFDAVDTTYYVRVMAQVPINPANVSNLADWHRNTAHADYTLEVTLPDRDTAPTIENPLQDDTIFVTEDTPHTTTVLSSIFADDDMTDPELQDALVYSLVNTPEHLEVSIDPVTTVLSLSPQADWSGQDYVLLRATDLYGKFAEYNISIVVSNENDQPVVAPGAVDLLRSFFVRHGQVNETYANISVASLFLDADIAFANDKLVYSVEGQTSDADVMPRITAANKLEFDPAQVYGNGAGPFIVPLTVTATDLMSEHVSYSVDVSAFPDEGIVKALQPSGQLTLDEGSSVLLDLTTYFVQTRSKQMHYSVTESTSPNITVAFNDNDTATLGSTGDFTSDIGVGLKVRAYTTVPFSEATVTLLVFVKDVPDAPRITQTVPDLSLITEISVAEGVGEEFFQVTVDDVDTPQNKLRFFWFVDGEPVTSSGRSWTYAPDYDAAGAHEVSIKVQDDAGLVATYAWPVTVTNTNRAPSVVFVTPQNNSQQDHSKVKFIAEATDPDGGTLTFEWSEAGTPVANPSTGNANGTTPAPSTVELTFKKGSTHQIDLVVTDSEGAKVRRSLVISIKTASGDTPGFEGVAMVAALMAAALLISARKRRTEEP